MPRPHRYVADISTEEEEEVICPYNKLHRIPVSKIQEHLTICKKGLQGRSGAELKTCPYNPNHRINAVKYDEHVENCPDASLDDTNGYDCEQLGKRGRQRNGNGFDNDRLHFEQDSRSRYKKSGPADTGRQVEQTVAPKGCKIMKGFGSSSKESNSGNFVRERSFRNPKDEHSERFDDPYRKKYARSKSNVDVDEDSIRRAQRNVVDQVREFQSVYNSNQQQRASGNLHHRGGGRTGAAAMADDDEYTDEQPFTKLRERPTYESGFANGRESSSKFAAAPKPRASYESEEPTPAPISLSIGGYGRGRPVNQQDEVPTKPGGLSSYNNRNDGHDDRRNQEFSSYHGRKDGFAKNRYDNEDEFHGGRLNDENSMGSRRQYEDSSRPDRRRWKEDFSEFRRKEEPPHSGYRYQKGFGDHRQNADHFSTHHRPLDDQYPNDYGRKADAFDPPIRKEEPYGCDGKFKIIKASAMFGPVEVAAPAIANPAAIRMNVDNGKRGSMRNEQELQEEDWDEGGGGVSNNNNGNGGERLRKFVILKPRDVFNLDDHYDQHYSQGAEYFRRGRTGRDDDGGGGGGGRNFYPNRRFEVKNPDEVFANGKQHARSRFASRPHSPVDEPRKPPELRWPFNKFAQNSTRDVEREEQQHGNTRNSDRASSETSYQQRSGGEDDRTRTPTNSTMRTGNEDDWNDNSTSGSTTVSTRRNSNFTEEWKRRGSTDNHLLQTNQFPNFVGGVQQAPIQSPIPNVGDKFARLADRPPMMNPFSTPMTPAAFQFVPQQFSRVVGGERKSPSEASGGNAFSPIMGGTASKAFSPISDEDVSSMRSYEQQSDRGNLITSISSGGGIVPRAMLIQHNSNSLSPQNYAPGGVSGGDTGAMAAALAAVASGGAADSTKPRVLSIYEQYEQFGLDDDDTSYMKPPEPVDPYTPNTNMAEIIAHLRNFGLQSPGFGSSHSSSPFSYAP